MSKLVRDAMTVNPRTVILSDPVVDAARIMEQEDEVDSLKAYVAGSA
jgi:hypothetical protein